MIFISIHALLAESDNCTSIGRPKRLYFYPRSPCGERLLEQSASYNAYLISIHALLAESDAVLLPTNDLFFLFLSTLSLRRATWLQIFLYYQDNRFLSTLSLRRATGGCVAGNWPRVIFLSTLSLRRATNFCCLYIKEVIISIHALLAESDSPASVMARGIFISIHALLAESDATRRSLLRVWRNFYPRSPCGERRIQ